MFKNCVFNISINADNQTSINEILAKMDFLEKLLIKSVKQNELGLNNELNIKSILDNNLEQLQKAIK